jgi:ClpP class serine protease
MGKTYEQLLDRQEFINRIEQKAHAKVITFFKNDLIHGGMITEQTVDDFRIAIDAIGSYEPVMIIIDSHGGLTYSGYCIASILARRTSSTLAVVPEEALSAATMIALGAKKLAMFPDARLSPIDPQYVYKGRYVSALDMLNHRERVIRADASRQIKLAEENLRTVCSTKLNGTKLDTFVERFLLKDKKHAAHGSHIYSDEVIKLGLKVKKEIQKSRQLDNDIKALHTLYKRHTFTADDPPTIIEYNRFPINIKSGLPRIVVKPKPKYFQF